jgi:hypothetical protein
MAKYRKKPSVIEAEQFHADTTPWPEGVIQCEPDPGKPKDFKIDTLEGPFQVSEGDWIIVGVKGERYPCKPDIFEATYERVET